MTTRTTSPFVTFRRTTAYALAVAAPLALLPLASLAQSAPPPDAPVAGQSGDPPSRVARLNYMAGTVTTEPAGASDWSYASVNRPLTTGDQLWNDANARSELHIGSTAVRLGASTNLDILNLDDSNAQLKVTQGTFSTHVRDLAPGSAYEIDTPNVALAVTRPGDYRVDVAPDGSTTTVTVRRGAVTAYGDNGQMPVAEGQQLTFSGTNLQVAADDQPPPPDAFDQWTEARDSAAERSVSARYVSREVPGYEDLDANGTWRDDPQYGEVWVPRAVPTGWAPYHDGHWAWVAPWGWTWVDDAPWGFAPYHYGRWAYAGSSWCWVPGPVVSAPVYAPALVAFVGGGGGGFSWSVGLSIGGASAPGVAWFPLGPGEVWRPSYGGWSPRYYERVNQTVIVNNQHITNINNINITNIHNTYVNYHAPGAVTAVPAAAFVQGRAVAHVAQRIDPQQLRNAQFHPGAPGIAPVRESYAPGLRPATYHPPGAAGERSVVATRAPAVPAVYRDPIAQRLAQNGGQVPGAGRPVAHLAPPAGVAAQLAHPTANPGPARNVRVVERSSPVIEPHQALNAGRPGLGAPAIATQGAIRPGPQQEPHAPTAALQARPLANNGIPRPPSQHGPVERSPAEAAQNATAIRREPSWTQPHAPIAQQHGPAAQLGAARGEAGSPQQPIGAQQRMPEHGQQAPQAMAHPGSMNVTEPQASPHVPQPRMEQHVPPQAAMQPHAAAPTPQRLEPRAQPQPQPRFEQARPQPQPHFEQPRSQPQPQAHFEQPRPQPQPQPHFEQPRPQPQPQVHIEQPRPQPQPQPHIEQPRPQPQPQHPQAQSHDNRHQG